MKTGIIHLFRACICVLLLCEISQAATYYVKNGGSDGATGLSDVNAWATIAKINDFAASPGFANGDIIQLKRGSKWSNDETLGKDSVGIINWVTVNGLTIQDYGTGDLPWLDGNTQQPILIVDTGITNLTLKNLDCSGGDWPSTWSYASVQLFSLTGLTIDNIYLDAHKDTVNYNYHPGGIGIKYVLGDIVIKNCTIKNLYKDTFENTVAEWPSIPGSEYPTGVFDDPGIIFWYDYAQYTGNKDEGSISIHDNTIENVYSDSLAIEGILCETNIYNNTLTGFGENAVDMKGSRYINIYNNDISWNDFGSQPGEAYWGATVIAGTPSAVSNNIPVGYITVHNNYIHDSSLACIRSDASLGLDVYNNYFKDVGMAFVADKNKTNQRFYNNLVVQTEPTGSSSAMDISVYKSGATLREGNSGTVVANNTFYITSTNHLYGIYVYNGSLATVKNNIIYMTRNSSSVYPIYSAGTGPTISYNCGYNTNHTNRAYENGTIYDNTEQAAWISAGHMGSLFSDPAMTAPVTSDLTLQGSSPCIDAGVNLGALYDDGLNPTSTLPDGLITLDQDTYGNGWEIGAYVYALSVYGVSPTDGATSVSLTGSVTWNYAAFVDDVDVWVTQGLCSAIDGCAGLPDSDDDADKTFDMTTIINGQENTAFCVSIKANDGVLQGDCQEFDFTTTDQAPTTPPLNLGVHNAVHSTKAGGMIQSSSAGSMLGD